MIISILRFYLTISWHVGHLPLLTQLGEKVVPWFREFSAWLLLRKTGPLFSPSLYIPFTNTLGSAYKGFGYYKGYFVDRGTDFWTRMSRTFHAMIFLETRVFRLLEEFWDKTAALIPGTECTIFLRICCRLRGSGI